VRAEKPANGDIAPETAPEGSTKSEALEKGAPEKPAEPEPAPEPAPAVKAAPANWADLLRKPAAAAAAPVKSNAVNGTASPSTPVNGHSTDGVVGATNGSASSFSKANASSVAEAIHSFHVGLADQVSFLEPRGLINTGNMCYMNSVGLNALFGPTTKLINARYCKF
jgi:ubiquitin carboxyl-terminal hydrolase 10